MLQHGEHGEHGHAPRTQPALHVLPVTSVVCAVISVVVLWIVAYRLRLPPIRLWPTRGRRERAQKGDDRPIVFIAEIERVNVGIEIGFDRPERSPEPSALRPRLSGRRGQQKCPSPTTHRPSPL